MNYNLVNNFKGIDHNCKNSKMRQMVRARYSARCSMEWGLIGPRSQQQWPSPGTQVRQ